MKRTIYNHYDIDDIKKMILDALQSYGAASKNDIQTFKDDLSKQIKDLSEEVSLITGYKDQIENHDLRIGHIEKHLHLAQPE